MWFYVKYIHLTGVSHGPGGFLQTQRARIMEFSVAEPRGLYTEVVGGDGLCDANTESSVPPGSPQRRAAGGAPSAHRSYD